jgi:large subunit ribosomal protein L4
MPKVAIKTKGGGTAGDIVLSERVFGAPRNLALIHQAVRVELENARQGTKNVLGRSDIDSGGRKPYRQKGTGRARQGSIVAPHYRHGGVALSFHPRDLGMSIPKKMRRAAIRAALSAKLADGELIVVDELPLGGAISTKAAAEFLTGVNGGAKKSLVVLGAFDDVTIKSVRNIGGVTLRVAPAFSTRDVVDGGTVVITRDAVAKIEALLGETVATAAPAGADASEAAPAPKKRAAAGKKAAAAQTEEATNA